MVETPTDIHQIRARHANNSTPFYSVASDDHFRALIALSLSF